VTVLAGASVGALLAAGPGPSPLLPFHLLAAVPGLLLALIDLRCLRLPDRLVGAVAIIAGVPSAVLRPDRIGSALVAGGLVLTAYLIVALLPGGGLGLGDVKLAGILGMLCAWFGWRELAFGLVAGFFVGALWGLQLVLRGKATRKDFIPLGPSLIVGALGVVMFS